MGRREGEGREGEERSRGGGHWCWCPRLGKEHALAWSSRLGPRPPTSEHPVGDHTPPPVSALPGGLEVKEAHPVSRLTGDLYVCLSVHTTEGAAVRATPRPRAPCLLMNTV